MEIKTLRERIKMVGGQPTVHLTTQEFCDLRNNVSLGLWVEWQRRTNLSAALQVGAISVFVDDDATFEQGLHELARALP